VARSADQVLIEIRDYRRGREGEILRRRGERARIYDWGRGCRANNFAQREKESLLQSMTNQGTGFASAQLRKLGGNEFQRGYEHTN